MILGTSTTAKRANLRRDGDRQFKKRFARGRSAGLTDLPARTVACAYFCAVVIRGFRSPLDCAFCTANAKAAPNLDSGNSFPLFSWLPSLISVHRQKQWVCQNVAV
jgi:hypothetical protein